jgi:undecaprenyl-diphosphatase
MSEKAPGQDDKRIAPSPVRRRHAEMFQFWTLTAAAFFVGLAVVAHFVPYFPVDLAVTRAIQQIRSPAFDVLMRAVSWPGFPPQVHGVCALAAIALFAAGLRWEAVVTVVAEAGILVGGLVKLLVFRPRPTADLVTILRVAGATSFPSGHVILAVTLAGFLAFLAFTLLHPSWLRTMLVALLVTTIPLMGASRIYFGHHWLSDVVGGYLLGSLWLALTIRIYRWGKTRFFVRQPAAAEAPRAHS